METEQLLQGGAPTKEDLIGVWEQTGYGFIVDIRSDGVDSFDFSTEDSDKIDLENDIQVLNEILGWVMTDLQVKACQMSGSLDCRMRSIVTIKIEGMKSLAYQWILKSRRFL